MTFRRFRNLAAIAILTGCSQTEPQIDANRLAADPDPRREVILLEHRGKRYPLSELSDNRFRRDSSDPFIRGFNPRKTYARPAVVQYSGFGTDGHDAID